MATRTDTAGSGRRGHAGRIGYLLRQAQVCVRHAIENRLRELDLTLPQFSIMTLIDAYDRPSGATLARLSMLTPQTVHGIVRTLERRGLVGRTPHPAHSRALALTLTEQGGTLLVSAREQVHKVEDLMTAGLSATEEHIIRGWLSGLAWRFEAEAAQRLENE